MQSASHFNPLWLLPIFPIFFVALWSLISFVISRLSGWSALSDRFRATLPFSGPTWKWQSARMRLGANYGNSLIVGADPAGLFLATIFVFRLGHVPLFLPWHEISIQGRGQILTFAYLKLVLGRDEQIPFQISGRLADRIRAAAGTSWPVEPRG
jgi:hypothetical protein